MKIEKLITLYIDYVKNVKRYSPKNVKAYQADLTQFEEFCILHSKYSAEKISERFLKSYLMELSESGLDKSSIARKLASIRGLFRFAFKNELIVSNPSAYIKNPKLSRKLPEITPTDSIMKIYEKADEIEKNP